jgi:hypothetical protein
MPSVVVLMPKAPPARASETARGWTEAGQYQAVSASASVSACQTRSGDASRWAFSWAE